MMRFSENVAVVLEESKELVTFLRVDWDNKWKSDNRRRTTLSLVSIFDARLVAGEINTQHKAH